MYMQLLFTFASENKAAVTIQSLWLRSPWRHPPASSAVDGSLARPPIIFQKALSEFRFATVDFGNFFPTISSCNKLDSHMIVRR